MVEKNYFKTAANKFVYYRTYSKWRNTIHRREHWPETVQRYINFLSEERGDKIPKKILSEIHENILDMETMPSMRMVWAAGEAARKDNVSCYNCFGKETKFVTKEGVKSFLDYKHLDEITVLTHTGKWKKAIVKNYGKQKLHTLNLKRGRNSQSVRVTKNHTWLLHDESRVTDLRGGEYLRPSQNIFMDFDYDNASPEEKLYWCYGYVYGDGTKIKSEGTDRYSKVRLCGEDIKFKYRFEEMGFTTSTNHSLKGDFIAYTGGYLKTSPDPKTDSPNMIKAFVRGYLDADGEKNTNTSKKNRPFINIQSSEKEHQNFIEQCFPIAGVFIHNKEDLTGKITNFGKRPETYKYYINNSFLTSDNCRFKVLDYSDTFYEEDVWCLEVEDDHSFILDFGLATGNCAFLPVDSFESFGETLIILMNGTGVGFSVEESYIKNVPEVAQQSGAGYGIYKVPDSKEGWKDSVDLLFKTMAVEGKDIEFDYSGVRERGARLNTMGGRACLTGDTIVYKDRKKSKDFNEVTIKELFDIQQKDVRGWFNSIKLRSLDEETGKFYRNKVIRVINNGIAPVYEVQTKNGYVIKATHNHRFMNKDRKYQHLSKFSIGENIAVNGAELKVKCCSDCGEYISRRAERCKPCFDKLQTSENVNDTTARNRLEKKLYVLTKTCCEICSLKESDTDKRFETHHIDENPHNNDHSNLSFLCSKCHQQLHARERSFGDAYSCKYLAFDEIISIELIGEEQVYDLQMEAPNHNFVANGFVSHNSGPEPLMKLHQFIKETLLEAQGRKLTDIECHDIMCEIADIVVVGGVRRSSLISFSDLSSEKMRFAKHGNFPIRRHMSNNSAAYFDKPSTVEFLHEWTALAESGSGERGIFNLTNLGKFGTRRDWTWTYKNHKRIPHRANPCLTGETVVAVADGRSDMTIKELADLGDDVPVYCLDNKGKTAIRWMRNPRKTGDDLPVFEVLLDDGSKVKATANHKFRTRDGEYKRVDELVSGDSLHLMTKSESPVFVEELGKNIDKDYIWINNKKQRVSEHRIIAEFFNDTIIGEGDVVHHKDFNSKNNRPSNLEIMSKKAHILIHSKNMIGDKNPMRRAKTEWSDEKWETYHNNMSDSVKEEKNGRFSGFSHDEIKQHILDLTKTLGRRITNMDWATYADTCNLPQSFSKWRKSHLGGLGGLFKWAAFTLEYEHFDVDSKTIRAYENLIEQGYNCTIENKKIVIHKICEVCEKEMTISCKHREIGVCSYSCSTKNRWLHHGDAFKQALIDPHKKRKESVKDQQLKIYSDLKFNNKCSVLKKEWVEKCKELNISPEISRSSSPFRSYKELKEAAGDFNHKVVSVTLVGNEDVYNGTVDEFHNFFVGGFETLNKNGRNKTQYVNTLNCGEILLRPFQFCNLSEVVIRPSDNFESLIQKVRMAVWIGAIQSTFTKFPSLRKIWKKNCEEECLLGVSLTGQMDNPKLLTPEKLEILKDYAIKTAKKAAKQLGINVSVAITTGKPSGCVTLDTEIKTDRGIMSMAEIAHYFDIPAISFKEDFWYDAKKPLFVFDENNEKQKINKFYVNKSTPVYELTDEKGKSYSFTGNHKLKLKSGEWKRVDELTVGDDILTY